MELGAYFSPSEIERGRAFARPQLALGLARGAVEAGRAGRCSRAAGGRPPAGASSNPALGGALTRRAALSLALTLPPLPLSVLARRRAIEVGLVTQSWRGWAADLVKSDGDPGGVQRRRPARRSPR